MKNLLPRLELEVKDRRWEGYTLWKYIKLNFPHYTKLLIIKELRLKNILVNHNKSYFQYKLKTGDTISILLLPERSGEKKKKKNIKVVKAISQKEILFENENIVIVFKSPGKTVQKENSGSKDSLEESLQSYINLNNSTNYKSKFVHRLDKPVSGLLIGAKNASSHSKLSEALKRRELQKIYSAIVIGRCNFKTRELKDWISDKGKKIRIESNPNLNSKFCFSKIRKIEEKKNLTLLEIQLITGRKNQIRAQLANIGFPILGDRKYYEEKTKKELERSLFFNPKRIALVATKLSFPNYLMGELNLPRSSFVLPKDKNIVFYFWTKS